MMKNTDDLKGGFKNSEKKSPKNEGKINVSLTFQMLKISKT